jgi:ABC-2 type transport system ATP-binding protein
VRFRARDVPDALLTGAEVLVRDGDRVELLVPDADGFVRDLVRRDVPFRDLEVATASLEEAFLALTGTPGEPS